MRFGDYDVQLIETGRFRLDGGAMFGVVPKVLWQKTNPADAQNRIEMALRCLLVRGGGRVLLVDSGIGNLWGPKQIEIYGIDAGHSSLDRSLEALGLTRSQITDVVFTHLHFDHVGGAVMQGTEGLPTLTFPKAVHYLHPDSWTHAHGPSPKDRASFVDQILTPFKGQADIRQVPNGYEFLPGVSSWVTHGHTPGHQMVRVEGGGRTLVFCGDTIPTASHLPIPYVMAYDLFPMTTMAEKQTLLEQAVQGDWILAFPHDPFVPAGTVGFSAGKYSLKKAVFLAED